MSDQRWELLRSLLPPQEVRRAHPTKGHRQFVNALLRLTRTGAAWRDLPVQYDPSQMVAIRFYRWKRAGIWDRVLVNLQQRADTEGALDWSL